MKTGMREPKLIVLSNILPESQTPIGEEVEVEFAGTIHPAMEPLGLLFDLLEPEEHTAWRKLGLPQRDRIPKVGLIEVVKRCGSIDLAEPRFNEEGGKFTPGEVKTRLQIAHVGADSNRDPGHLLRV